LGAGGSAVGSLGAALDAVGGGVAAALEECRPHPLEPQLEASTTRALAPNARRTRFAQIFPLTRSSTSGHFARALGHAIGTATNTTSLVSISTERRKGLPCLFVSCSSTCLMRFENGANFTSTGVPVFSWPER